ncbi:MAG: hypothetical protein ACM3JL_01620 [Nitrososphaerota archaeon]
MFRFAGKLAAALVPAVLLLPGSAPALTLAPPAPVAEESAQVEYAPAGGPQYEPAPMYSWVAIRAVSRKVKRHRRGLIIAWVMPCRERERDRVSLWRGRRRLRTRRLNLACSVRFRPKVNRRSTFRVEVEGDDLYMPAVSRKLTLRPVRHLPHRFRFIHRPIG